MIVKLAPACFFFCSVLLLFFSIRPVVRLIYVTWLWMSLQEVQITSRFTRQGNPRYVYFYYICCFVLFSCMLTVGRTFSITIPLQEGGPKRGAGCTVLRRVPRGTARTSAHSRARTHRTALRASVLARAIPSRGY